MCTPPGKVKVKVIPFSLSSSNTCPSPLGERVSGDGAENPDPIETDSKPSKYLSPIAEVNCCARAFFIDIYIYSGSITWFLGTKFRTLLKLELIRVMSDVSTSCLIHRNASLTFFGEWSSVTTKCKINLHYTVPNRFLSSYSPYETKVTASRPSTNHGTASQLWANKSSYRVPVIKLIVYSYSITLSTCSWSCIF